MEIRPRPGPCSASSLARVATIRPPVAANGCPAASEEPLTLSFGAVDRAERRVQAEPLLAELGSSHAVSVASTCEANASWIS